MKRGKIISITILVFFVCSLVNLTYAQTANNNTAKSERAVGEFNAVKVGETFIITFTPGENYSVIVETDENSLPNISTEVIDGVLTISNTNLRSPNILMVYITAPSLSEIELSGASEFYSKEIISGEVLKIKTSGAATAQIATKTNDLEIAMHGASDLTLSGTTNNMAVTLEETSSLNTSDLTAKTAVVISKNSSVANVNVTDNLDITSYTNSRVSYIGDPQKVSENKLTSQNDKSRRTFSINDRDGFEYRSRSRSSSTNFGSINITVNDREDTTMVVLGRHQFIIDDYGNARYRKIYRNRFNGHWGGIDIGINGYLTTDFDMSFPNDYDFLDLNLGNSIRFDINLLEQNIPLSKNRKHWGFVTGVGVEFRDYSFDNNITIIPDEEQIVGYTNRGASPKKNKLKVVYANVPFLLEYQTNAYNERNSFHISVGAVFGLRIGSKTKMVFNKKENTYDLLDAQGIPVLTVTTDKRRVKEHNSYHLNPIKADAMFRIGWGWFNFYATYSMTTLFKKNEGPELYPFSFGMTLLKW